jgi:hypothetical protein
MKGSSSNKGLHQRCFYLRSDADAPLITYTGRFFEEAPEHWGYGPVTIDKWKIDTLLQAVKCLVNVDITGAGVIATFHERRVLPLMWWACHLDEMVPNTPLNGTMLLTGELDREETRSTSSWCLRVSLLTPPSTSTRRCIPMMVSSRW